MSKEQEGSSGKVRFFTVPIFARRKMELPPLKLSPHSVGVFRECRQHYKFRYVDKLGDEYGRARPYYTMGNHVHATLKDFLSVVPVEQRTSETIERVLRKNWRRYRIGFRNRTDERRWAEKALSQVRAFVAAQDVTVWPLMLETPVEAEITAGVILRGRVDRVDREDGGGLHIIDYKTGNMPDESDWTQLHLHALILSRMLPYPVVKVSFYYLSPGILDTVQLSTNDLEQARWGLLVTGGQIRREKQYRPSPGHVCRRCDFRSICPAKEETYQGEFEGDFELWRDMVQGREDAGTG